MTVAIKAISTNDASVFVGSSTVSIINGWELGPGESVEIDLDHAEEAVWVVALVVPQVVSWLVLQR